MINDSTVKIYIDVSKPYYYPGESFSATILLDVSDTTKCDKMQIIAKGKEIVNAFQKTYIYSDIDFDDEENSNEYDDDSKNKKRRFDYNTSDDSSSEEKEKEKNNTSSGLKLDYTRKIFKYKKIVQISNNKYLEQENILFLLKFNYQKVFQEVFLWRKIHILKLYIP